MLSNLIPDINDDPQRRELLNNNFDVIISMYLNVDVNSEKCREISRKVKSFYLGDEPISKDTLQQIAEVSSTP
jgi:hypothetical protein